MTDPVPPVLPHGVLRWLAVLFGAAPHLAIVVYSGMPREFGFMGPENQLGLVTFAIYGTPELYIVPATLLVAVGLWAARRTRFLALWVLLGTLGGATVVLLTLVSTAHTEIAIAAPA